MNGPMLIIAPPNPSLAGGIDSIRAVEGFSTSDNGGDRTGGGVASCSYLSARRLASAHHAMDSLLLLDDDGIGVLEGRQRQRR